MTVLGGIQEPLVLGQLPDFLERCRVKSQEKIRSSLGIGPEEYKLRYIVYGEPSAGPVGVLWEIIGKTREDAQAMINSLWHNVLHVSIPQWSGHQSQFAFPFSPPAMDGGDAYRFVLNHVLEVDDPMELCRTEYFDLGEEAER